MLVTVLIPAFRAAAKLSTTIDAALAQGDAVEVVVVDGGSTDGTLDVLRRYAAEHGERFRFVSEPDAGVYDAMNKGLRLARGDYVTIFGAGDTMTPGIVERLRPHLPADSTSRVVYGGIFRRGRESTRAFGRFFFTRVNICHQAIYYGRAAIERVGDYRQKYRLLADWEYNFRCWSDPAVAMHFVPLCFATFEGGGMSEADRDVAFRREQGALVRKHLGWLAYLYFLAWHSPHTTSIWAYHHLGLKAGRDRWFR